MSQDLRRYTPDQEVEKAKQVATKSAASKQAKVPNTKQKTHQKPAKDKKNTEQTMASAPAKEDAPVTTPQ